MKNLRHSPLPASYFLVLQRSFIYRLCALVVLCAAGIALRAESEKTEEEPPDQPRTLAVVTHVDNEIESITRSELARIFLKQQTTWSDGERCIPIDQRGDSAIRKEFSKLVLQQTVYDVRRYWMQETMTGNTKPPVSLESSVTVKKYLEKLRGAVAYIYLDEVEDNVKILEVRDVPALATPVLAEGDETSNDEAGSPDTPPPADTP